MNKQEFNNKSISELYDSLQSMKKELLGLRIQKSMGQLTNSSLIRKNRRNIAQIMMHLAQKKVK
ncbi:50S ribosomal protein L29 [Candidatus Odyssella thessalonicensis]|uniref:50S ribosomal protein L29 n=1 Tax=Candidatus Odyssella thessalonicensis TaxID=84647 RepID=UPI000225BC7B|nr:50S ribosomal protein L29 [Candidatus Odyssella thessalonicensis]